MWKKLSYLHYRVCSLCFDPVWTRPLRFPSRDKSGLTRFPANESPRRTGLHWSLSAKEIEEKWYLSYGAIFIISHHMTNIIMHNIMNIVHDDICHIERKIILFYFILKSSFYFPAFEISRSCRTASGLGQMCSLCFDPIKLRTTPVRFVSFL